jgi:anti-sigma regulatory factor (Ser/Thr protein kinase)
MEVNALRSFEVAEPTQAGEARRAAISFAREVGFDDIEAGKLGIVVTEAASNMVKHAAGGRLLVHAMASGGRQGVGTLALDRGPGVANLAEMMRDGFSTRGTPGTGFGAMVRQSQQFDVYSAPGRGTAVFAGVWPKNGVPAEGKGAATPAVGGVCVPVRGERECGDGWAQETFDGRLRLLVTDGLGHGVLAHEASAKAANIFHAQPGRALEDLMGHLHEALAPTRGAAVALVEIRPARETLSYCGIGNIVGRLFANGADRRLVSHFGTVGHDLQRVRTFEYPWPRSATLVLHTDGLKDHWALDDYPGLQGRDPTLIAGVLFRDHARERDDCTVVVVRSAA